MNTTDYRFFLEAGDFSIQPIRIDKRIWFDDTTMRDCLWQVERGMYLVVWDDQRMSGGKLRTAWASIDLLDVRYKGAYLERPDFWPSEEGEEE